MSLENPSTKLSDPDAWLTDALIGGPVDTGVAVNNTTAMGYHAVWRAVNCLAKDTAKTAIHVYRYGANGSRERDRKNPISELIAVQPNQIMTAFNFWFAMMVQRLLNGNAYAFIERTVTGTVKALHMLDGNNMNVAREEGTSNIYYAYTPSGTKATIFQPNEILHLRGTSWNGVTGYSVVQYARQTMGMGIGASKWQAKFFKNGAKVSIVLEHPGTLGKEAQDRLKESFHLLYSGIENSHKTAVLEEGMTAKPLTINPKDAQVLELLNANVVAVANIFNLPVHKLGVTGSQSYASLEQENQRYLDDALDPLMVEIEQELNIKLLTPKERQDSFIEFERKSLLRADLAARSAFYQKAVGNVPFMTVNEVRRVENMNPINDPKFDTIVLPTNNFDPTKTSDGGTAQRSDILRGDLERILSDNATRMFNRGTLQASAAITKGRADKWLGEYRAESQPIISDTLAALSSAFSKLGCGEADTILARWSEVIMESVEKCASALQERGAKESIVKKRALESMLQNIMEAIQ